MSLVYVFIFLLVLIVFFLLYQNRKLKLILNRLNFSTSKIAEEDILKSIYFLTREGKNTDIFSLKGRTGLSEELLMEILNLLQRKKLLVYKNGKFFLTEAGKKNALQIIRFHRIYEKWLFEKTGFSKKEWHKIAEAEEHRLSREEINRLYKELGYPLFDPHGDPIPSDTGEIPVLTWKNLREVPEKSFIKILHIEDEPENIYFRILDKGIFVGDEGEILIRNPQEITLKINNKEIILSPLEAGNINVELLPSCRYDVVPLTELKQGETAEIVRIKKECRRITRRRLLDLGFVKGAQVKVYLQSIFKDPVSYEIKDSYIALRSDQAKNILIRKV